MFSVSGTIPSTLHEVTYFVLIAFEVYIVVQIRKMNRRKVRTLAEGHTVMWQAWV